MSVTMMTDKYVIEKGRGADIQPADAFIVSYQGAVLAVRERSFSDDSDFYAVVWDGERLRTVEYGTTRFWTYPNHAEADATPEVIEAVRAWLLPQMVAFAVAAERDRNANPAVMDRKVVVVVANGTTGDVDQITRTNYDNSKRLRIRLLDGSHVWTAAANCDVVERQRVNEDAVRDRVVSLLGRAEAYDLARYFAGMTSPLPSL